VRALEDDGVERLLGRLHLTSQRSCEESLVCIRPDS
jgi:hypothetical protein